METALGKVLATPAAFDGQNPHGNARHGGLQLLPSTGDETGRSVVLISQLV